MLVPGVHIQVGVKDLGDNFDLRADTTLYFLIILVLVLVLFIRCPVTLKVQEFI